MMAVDDLPSWADEKMTAEIPRLIGSGEGQQLEFKSDWPQHVARLVKGVAAFSTSGSGRILLGIAPTGEAVGFPDAETAAGRDDVALRISGLCREHVKPAVVPDLRWALAEDKAIGVLTVPKGRSPVYYWKNVPYVRHLSESRPAKPSEVEELIRSSPVRSEEPRQPRPHEVEAERLRKTKALLASYVEKGIELCQDDWLNHKAASDYCERVHALIRACSSGGPLGPIGQTAGSHIPMAKSAGDTKSGAWQRVNMIVQTLKSATRNLRAHEVRSDFDPDSWNPWTS